MNVFSSVSEKIYRIRQRFTWYNRIIDTVWYDIPRFIKNIIYFKKELYQFRPWDWSYNFEIFKRSLEATKKSMDNFSDFNGINENFKKKAFKINRAIELMNHFIIDDFMDMAEKELGELPNLPMEFESIEGEPDLMRMVDKSKPEEKEQSKNVFDRTREIENAMWKELWQIMEGQDMEKYYKERSPEIANDYEKADTDYDNFFDGSDLRSWWT